MSAIAAAAIGAGASLIGTGVSAGMSSSAAAASAKQQREAMLAQYKLQKQGLNRYMRDIQPYVNQGLANLPVYNEALNAYTGRIPGYFDQLANYQAAVDRYNQQGIPGIQQAIQQYQTVAPQYQQAMQNYNAALGRYEGMAGQIGDVTGQIGAVAQDYQKALDKYNEAAGQYTAALPRLTREYGMEQYKESPFYTPMVTNLAELQATPGYQFQLQQGQKALAQSAAARGGMLSGAQQQAAQRFGQQQAATGFQDAWQRAQTAYQNAINQDALAKQQISGSLLSNAGFYQTGAGLTGAKADIYGKQLAGLGQQAGIMQNALGGYGQAVNQVAGLGDIYNTGVGQAQNLAGAYQNAAGLAGTGANLYGQGMNLYNTDIANRYQAANLGYDALNRIQAARQNANNLMGNAIQGYGNAGAAGSLAQAGITGAAIGQGLGALGGLAGYGINQGWFNPSQPSNPSSGGFSNVDWNQQLGKGGFLQTKPMILQ